MKAISLVSSALLLLSSGSNASTVFGAGSSSCSGVESVSISSGTTLSCTGNYSLIGGGINSSTSISISVDGVLWLEDISLSAPVIAITAGSTGGGNGVIMIADSIMLNLTNSGSGAVVPRCGGAGGVIQVGGSSNPSDCAVSVTSGGSNLISGGKVSLSPEVPIPSPLWSLLSGVFALFTVKGFERKSHNISFQGTR